MQKMLAVRNFKLEKILSLGKEIFYNSFKSISFLILTLLIQLKFGPLSWGQLSIYYLSLIVLQHISLFSFETFCQHSIIESPAEATSIWSNAISVRLGIAYLLVALLTLIKLPFTLLAMTALYLVLNVYNEAFKVAAKIEDKINTWSLISWTSVLGAYSWIIFSSVPLLFQDLLIVLTIAQCIRFILLNYHFYWKYKIPLLPRTDFTQLKLSGSYFLRSSIVLLNYKLPFFMAAFLLGVNAMSTLHLILLWLLAGCAIIHQLGIQGIFNFNRWTQDVLKAQILKMLIVGTIAGLVWIWLGITLSIKIPFALISPWWTVPVFIILLLTWVQLPLLHALLKEQEEKKIIQIYTLIIILQAILGYWFLSRHEIGNCLWALAFTALLQTYSYLKSIFKIL